MECIFPWSSTGTSSIIYYINQERIQDLWYGGEGGGKGSGDRLRFPSGPMQSPGRGPGGRSSGGFEELQTFI